MIEKKNKQIFMNLCNNTKGPKFKKLKLQKENERMKQGKKKFEKCLKMYSIC